MKFLKRGLAAAVTAAMIATTFALIEGQASAAGGVYPISLSCAGITTDGPGSGTPASSLGSSAQTLAVMGGALSIGGEVTSTIPSKVRPSDPPFTASFAIKVILPDALVNQAKALLKTDRFDITGASFAVNYSGGASGTIQQDVPDQTVTLASTPASVTNTISGVIKPTGNGVINFAPGSAAFGIAINKTVTVAGATVTVNTLRVTCKATGEVGTTNVQVPGAPNVEPGLVTAMAGPGEDAVVNLAANISPDDGNPIIPGSLRMVSQTGSGAVQLGTFVGYHYPPDGKANTVTMEVCGASRIAKGRPGVNEVQTLAWNQDWNTDFNSHPIAFSLKVGDEETKVMSTSSARDLLGNPVPTPIRPEDDFLLLNRANSHFNPPSAATVQAELQKLPSIGFGNIKVTSIAGGYDFEFTGIKGNQPINTKISIGKWFTWMPADAYAAVQGLISGGGGGGSATTTVPGTPAEPTKTIPELQADLAAGRITLQKFFDRLPDAVLPTLLSNIDLPEAVRQLPRIFPQPPAFDTKTLGLVTIPDAPTGPLCTSFQVQFKQDAFKSFVAAVLWYQALQKVSVQGKTKSRSCSGKLVKVRTTRKQTYYRNGKRHTRYVKGTTYVCRSTKSNKRR